MNAPQELLKQYVQSQHFTSTADIMAAMKEMFRDVIQQVTAVEMDEELGRERCIVRQIRSSTKYVSYKDSKKLVADLKKIYTAVTLQEAEENLSSLDRKSVV